MPRKPQDAVTVNPTSRLAQLAGSQPPLMPGESADAYQAGLQSLMEELGAQTELQRYLAQKMFDCVWMVRGYDRAIQGVILNMLLEIVDSRLPGRLDDGTDPRALILAGRWEDEGLLAALRRIRHTPQTLHAEALSRVRTKLLHLEQLVAIRSKSYHQLHASFEALVSRPVIQQRLRMQNALLARDLDAISATDAIDGPAPSGAGRRSVRAPKRSLGQGA
jgi:hypothetical protein